MPHYDYQCQNCGYSFEVFQTINEEPLYKCPHCGGSLKRLIGGGCGLIFKGSGFYITDYKRNNSKKEEKKETQPRDSREKSSQGSSSQTQKES